MTTDRETTRIVRSWMQLGVDQMPERVLDAVLDELPTTPQRRSLRPAWRSLQMPNVIKLAAAAVAVLVVAVVGFQLLPASGGIGGPAATPAPTGTPTPVPTHTPTPSPSPSVIAVGATNTPLKAGTYRVADPFKPFTISFPAPWTISAAEQTGVAFYRTEPANFAPSVIIDRVHRVYSDPCHPDSSSQPRAETAPVADLVAQLRAMKGFTAGPVSDVTLGGHPAKSFRLTNAITLDAALKCEGSPLDIWEGGLGRNTTNQGATDQIWVVDVNGTPITIDAQSVPGKTPADLVAEVEQVVESIHFDQ